MRISMQFHHSRWGFNEKHMGISCWIRLYIQLTHRCHRFFSAELPESWVKIIQQFLCTKFWFPCTIYHTYLGHGWPWHISILCMFSWPVHGDPQPVGPFAWHLWRPTLQWSWATLHVPPSPCAQRLATIKIFFDLNFLFFFLTANVFQ